MRTTSGTPLDRSPARLRKDTATSPRGLLPWAMMLPERTLRSAAEPKSGAVKRSELPCQNLKAMRCAHGKEQYGLAPQLPQSLLSFVEDAALLRLAVDGVLLDPDDELAVI